jgi:hypothetical protein
MRRKALIGVLVVVLGGCSESGGTDVENLVRHVERGGGASADFDSVRRFIQVHSVHRKGAELNSLRASGGFAREVLRHVTNERKEPVPMLCGARARLAHDLFEALGYDARIVHIFDAESSSSHTFADGWNPTTARWETSDTDYNIFWRNVKSGARIAVTDYAPDRLHQVEPCNDQGCGWNVVAKAKMLRTLFDRVKVDDD